MILSTVQSSVDRNFFTRLLPAPKGGGCRIENYWTWCGSVIRDDDGRYVMFVSRWDKRLSFSPHWLTNSEIVMAVSDEAMGPYRFERVVLGAHDHAAWDGRMTHNPSVIKHDGRYLLFYTGTTYSGATPTHDAPATLPGHEESGDPAKMLQLDHRVLEAHRNQRIGLAVADRLDGPWRRPESPLIEPRPGQWDGLITTNPAPCVTPEGSLLLVYKSVARLGAMMHLGVAGSDRYDRPFRRLRDDPILRASSVGDHVEDPFLWYADGRYRLIMKSMNGKLGGEARGGIAIESVDGVNWSVSSEAKKAYSRKIRWDDGSTTTQAFLERPQLLIEDGKPTFMFAATAVGSDAIGHVTDSWNMAIPLMD
ncbi:MAG: glycoside hydrolase family protein [Planctomycetota bacterium]